MSRREIALGAGSGRLLPIMELRNLRYLQAMAEDLSFSKAGRRLRIAQPAMSRAVQEMERELRIAGDQWLRTMRKPTWSAAKLPGMLNRLAQRASAAECLQLPPLTTQALPLSGPSGSMSMGGSSLVRGQ